MFVPKEDSSSSDPCSVKRRHCEHPCAKTLPAVNTKKVKTTPTRFLMSQRYVFQTTGC